MKHNDPRPTTEDMPLVERKQVLQLRSKTNRKAWETRKRMAAVRSGASPVRVPLADR